MIGAMITRRCVMENSSDYYSSYFLIARIVGEPETKRKERQEEMFWFLYVFGIVVVDGRIVENDSA